MAEERNRYQRKKIFLTVMHVLFLVVTAAGISAMYLNSDYGKGISWVYDEVYEDSPQFSTRLEQDIEKIFSYVGYRDVFETDGKLDMERTIVGISDGPGLSEELTLDQLVRYAKTRGYYLDENFTVQGVPTSMDDDDDEITVDWQSYNPNFMDRELEENRMTREDLALDVLDHLGDYYSIYYNYIENKTNMHFRIAYHSDDGKDQIYTNAPELSVEEMKASGRYLYIPGNTIRMESNLADVPVNVAPYLEMWNPFGNNKYYLIVSVDTSYPNDDTYARQAAQYNSARDNFIVGMAGVVVGMVGCLATILLLMMMSGHTFAGSEDIRLYPSDETFTEVGLAMWVICVFACLYLGKLVGNRLISLFFKEDQWGYWIKLMRILVIYAGSMICFFGMIRRYKARTLWSNSLTKRVIDHTQDYRNRAAFAFGMGIGFAMVLFLNCMMIWSMFSMFLIEEKTIKQKMIFYAIAVFFALFNLLIFHLMFSKALQMDQLDGAIRSISQGNTSLQMNLERLNGKERIMGEHINNISIGLDAALQEKVKSERLKADLITNVSHDIKTPLTSIINYVDLLKREHIQDPKIQGYLEVLEQKSQRLKTLTEDLVEASKASSGNLKLEIADIDLVELVQQTGGEFAEKFERRHLEVVSHLPKEPLLIRADGRRMWRILENLYNNAFKYAMERSRIYVDVFQQNGRAVFTIKNVSESPLNISPDELTERFVRGDVSRTTEGSGLGLSIAKSLTQLQGGEFDIVIDGDLFKAVVSFPVKWTTIEDCLDKLDEPGTELETADEIHKDKMIETEDSGGNIPKSGTDNWTQ